MKKTPKLLCVLLCLMLVLAPVSGLAQASSGKLFDAPFVISVIRSEHANQPMRSDAPVLEWIKEATNVELKMEAIPSADYNTKSQVLIATDSMPDMMMGITAADYIKFAADGMFLCISDYLDAGAMPNFKALYDTAPEFKNLYVGGKLYTMPNAARYVNRMGLVPMIRKDLLEKYGLTMPTSFDELYEVLKVFREKEPDEKVSPYVMRNFNIVGNIAFPMGAGRGMYFDGDVDGGTWLYGQATENFKAVITFMSSMYADGILDPDYASVKAQEWQEKMSTGRGLFYFDNPSFAINFDVALKTIDPSFELAPMPSLSNSFGQTRNYFYSLHWMDRTIVNSEVKEPDKIIKYLDWLYSQEGSDLTNFGIEGVHYDKVGDEYVLKPEIVEKHLKDSDPWRGFMGEYGVGLLGVAQYIDERNQWPFMPTQTKAWYDLWIDDPAMRNPAVAPVLTEEERAEYADIMAKCDTIYESEIHNFITGKKAIAEWDLVVQQFKEAGCERAQEIYRIAMERAQ